MLSPPAPWRRVVVGDMFVSSCVESMHRTSLKQSKFSFLGDADDDNFHVYKTPTDLYLE